MPIFEYMSISFVNEGDSLNEELNHWGISGWCAWAMETVEPPTGFKKHYLVHLRRVIPPYGYWREGE